MSNQGILYEGWEQWAIKHDWLKVMTERIMEDEGMLKDIWVAPSGKIIVVRVKDETVVRVREARD